jgi:hypothetical protein
MNESDFYCKLNYKVYILLSLHDFIFLRSCVKSHPCQPYPLRLESLIYPYITNSKLNLQISNVNFLFIFLLTHGYAGILQEDNSFLNNVLFDNMITLAAE